jgi:hypothetical protein
MAMTTRYAIVALFLYTLAALAAMPGHASLFSLAASGTISENSSGDSTIPNGTPWTFELTYDTAAPDLEPGDATFGRFANTAAPPAMTFFHYRAGIYEVTMDDPADFGAFGGIAITFTASIDGIDVNIFAPDFFPPLADGPVSFHADFARFTHPRIFTSDALPTNTALGPASFDDHNVTLLPHAGVVSSSNLTGLTLTAVTSLTADFNQNGRVTAADLTDWKLGFGLASGATHLQGDANADGRVDGADFLAWQRQLGSHSAVMAAITVPEPDAFVAACILVGGLVIAGSRRSYGRAGFAVR